MKEGVKLFPHKLFALLEYASNSQWSSVISWSESGEEFNIKDRDRLRDILPMFFNSVKFKSFVSSSRIASSIAFVRGAAMLIESIPSAHFIFLHCIPQTRQLNLWGFVRINRDANRWRHKSFLRGEPNRLDDLRYVKVKGPRKVKAQHLAFQIKAKEDSNIADRLASKTSQRSASTTSTNMANANEASRAATGGRVTPSPRPEAWSTPDSRKKPRPDEAGSQTTLGLREDSWEDPSVFHYLGDIIGGPTKNESLACVATRTPAPPTKPKVLRGKLSGGNSLMGARAPGPNEVTGASDTKHFLRQSFESGKPVHREDEEEAFLLRLILSL